MSQKRAYNAPIPPEKPSGAVFAPEAPFLDKVPAAGGRLDRRGRDVATSSPSLASAQRGAPLDSVYLDHNATTQVRPEVVRGMTECLAGAPGNPSSLHRFGRAAARLREEARERVAAAAGCLPGEVVFTSGGTEADNLALRASCVGDGKRLVTATTEHEAVLQTAEALEKAGGRVTFLAVDEDGRIATDRLEAALRPGAALVSLMAANNETGVLHDLASLGAACRAAGVPFHTDAVQFFGKLPFRFADLPVDLASISAHKIGGPKGVGALLVRRGTTLPAVLTGGSQEQRIRPGTENLPGIVGFGLAAELAAQELAGEVPRLEALRNRLEQGILGVLPSARINGAAGPRLPNTSNVSFPGLDGESLLVALDLEGVAVSTGAACNAGAAAPSHVLRAMGRTRAEAAGSLRFSLGRTSCDAEVERALESLDLVVARLQRNGPAREAGRALNSGVNR